MNFNAYASQEFSARPELEKSNNQFTHRLAVSFGKYLSLWQECHDYDTRLSPELLGAMQALWCLNLFPLFLKVWAGGRYRCAVIAEPRILRWRKGSSRLKTA